MLTVRYDDGAVVNVKNRQDLGSVQICLKDVYRVTAHGYSLVQLRTRFVNIPCGITSEPVSYFGDMARFILANIHMDD